MVTGFRQLKAKRALGTRRDEAYRSGAVKVSGITITPPFGARVCSAMVVGCFLTKPATADRAWRTRSRQRTRRRHQREHTLLLSEFFRHAARRTQCLP